MEHETNRIEIGGRGLGVITPELIQERAEEIARADGRNSPHRGDLDSARRELQGAILGPPETDDATGLLTAWDDPPTATGTQTSKVFPEDEPETVTHLIEEGIEEADHDRRVQAARQDFEPEE